MKAKVSGGRVEGFGWKFEGVSRRARRDERGGLMVSGFGCAPPAGHEHHARVSLVLSARLGHRRGPAHCHQCVAPHLPKPTALTPGFRALGRAGTGEAQRWGSGFEVSRRRSVAEVGVWVWGLGCTMRWGPPRRGTVVAEDVVESSPASRPDGVALPELSSSSSPDVSERGGDEPEPSDDARFFPCECEEE